MSRYKRFLQILLVILLSTMLTSCFVRSTTHDAVVAENARLRSEIQDISERYEQEVSANEQLQTRLEEYMMDPQRLFAELEIAFVDDNFEIVKDRYQKLHDYHMNYDYFPIAKIMYEQVIKREAAGAKPQEQKPDEENATPKQFEEKLLGEWRDPDVPYDPVTIIQTSENRFNLIYTFSDGSTFIEPHFIKELKNSKATLLPVEDNFGEYLILDLNTRTMELHNDYGYDRTLRPIDTIPLQFLEDGDFQLK